MIDPEQYAAIMAGVKAESETNVAYDDARNAVIVAARTAWDALTFGNIHRIQKATITLGDAINVLDALEHAP